MFCKDKDVAPLESIPGGLSLQKMLSVIENMCMNIAYETDVPVENKLHFVNHIWREHRSYWRCLFDRSSAMTDASELTMVKVD